MQLLLSGFKILLREFQLLLHCLELDFLVGYLRLQQNYALLTALLRLQLFLQRLIILYQILKPFVILLDLLELRIVHHLVSLQLSGQYHLRA